MRITTNAILRNYRSNLGTSMTTLATARDKVMTGRQFTAAAQDPAGALRSANLERKYMRNQDYLSNVKDAQAFQDSQEDALMQITTLATKLSKQYGTEALSATNQGMDVRQTYANAWRGAQESMVMSMNATYEDKYVFAGADGMNPPFRLVDNADGTQTLTYRGYDVNGSANAAILKELGMETAYVDLGFGLTNGADGKVDPSSAFDSSLPGINVIGYGTDGNDPKNMILLAGEIAKELESPDFSTERLDELLGKFDAGRQQVLEQVTTLGTKTEFLTTTFDRLDTNRISLSKQLDNVVNIDMAQAITEFSWAQYAYNASLKVGTQILAPSFIDFMK